MRVSRHGEKRIRQRVGIPRRSVERLARVILERGTRREAHKGRLRRYLDRKYEGTVASKKGSVIDVILYGGTIYVIADETILTAYKLPSKLVRRKRYREREAAE